MSGVRAMRRAVAAGTAGGAILTSAATAGSGVSTLSSDAAFIALETSGGFTKQLAASVRWGDGGASGDWEYAIVDGADAPIGAIGQTPWAGTNLHTVSFSFDPGAGSADLSLSGIGGLSRTAAATPTVIWARVRDSATPFSSLTNIAVDLAATGPGVDYTYASLLGDADAEYWGVSDERLKLGFTITATAELAGPRTAGSDPMYQFKVGIPAPGASALLLLAGATTARRRRVSSARPPRPDPSPRPPGPRLSVRKVG